MLIFPDLCFFLFFAIENDSIGNSAGGVAKILRQSEYNVDSDFTAFRTISFLVGVIAYNPIPPAKPAVLDLTQQHKHKPKKMLTIRHADYSAWLHF
ncbi:MAG: hypothetical protein JSR32_06290 [Proteobacteria bacterium]|nr:hypothetical protein [Pseudomonadota bacterium]